MLVHATLRHRENLVIYAFHIHNLYKVIIQISYLLNYLHTSAYDYLFCNVQALAVRIQIANQINIRMEFVRLGSVHAERAVTYVPERPHFVEKRMPQVPRLQKMMAKTMPNVKYVNTIFNFVFGSWCLAQ